MRRRQVNAMRAQEVAVTITERGTFLPYNYGRSAEPGDVRSPDEHIDHPAGMLRCPKCKRLMKASGGAKAHIGKCQAE